MATMLRGSPGHFSRQSSAIDFTLHRDNVNRHMCHMRMSLKAKKCLGNFTSLASASTPNPPQRFACLCTRTALQMRLQHCPPISVLTTPYAFTPPP
ncbi:hypothetical protein O181_080822 [Austropuccinia psidii MF-1]|uniref:Uncharacterized protein n=1 Tax=Austropuccinia psidii MF-1 TaxID=1389203 RepID=A0A9Q3IHT3_9BASI|nr:hypothetical protein [Austropuccinia psidii MF-1]